MVHRQIHHRIDEERKKLKSQGVPDEEIEKKGKEMHKDFQAPVEREVKVYLILDKIAEAEKIEVKEGENLPMKVIEFLLKEAKWEGA